MTVDVFSNGVLYKHIPKQNIETIKNSVELCNDTGIFAEDSKIILKVITANDYEIYEKFWSDTSEESNQPIDFQSETPQNPVDKFINKTYQDSFNKVVNEGINCWIILKENEYCCGYCGIKDLNSLIPEIQIELFKDSQGKGIGYRALKLLMEKYSYIFGTSEFRSIVNPYNNRSIKLMRKLGGKSNGTRTILDIEFNDEIVKLLAKETKNEITDDILELSKEFNIEPVMLQSNVYVLEFIIKI